MIIVTGASDGLGAAVVQQLSLVNELAINVSRHANDKANGNILADLSKARGVELAAQEIMMTKDVKAVVINAGVLSIQKIQDITEEEYERVMAVNLRAPTLLLALLFDWIRDNEIDIVFVNSVAGLRGFQGQALYNTSKWGLRGLTESIREELVGTKSRVISVYPGMLDTNMASKLPTPLPKSKHSAIPAEEVARMIVQAIQQPKAMEVTDIVIERKKSLS